VKTTELPKNLGENKKTKAKLLAGTIGPIGCSGYSYTRLYKYTVHLSVLARLVRIAMKRFQQFQASPRRRQIGRWHDRSLLPPSYGFFIHTILALSAEDEEGNAMQGHPWHTLRTGATCQKTVKGCQTIGFPLLKWCAKVVWEASPNNSST
jgi:hypothetical protein